MPAILNSVALAYPAWPRPAWSAPPLPSEDEQENQRRMRQPRLPLQHRHSEHHERGERGYGCGAAKNIMKMWPLQSHHTTNSPSQFICRTTFGLCGAGGCVGPLNASAGREGASGPLMPLRAGGCVGPLNHEVTKEKRRKKRDHFSPLCGIVHRAPRARAHR